MSLLPLSLPSSIDLTAMDSTLLITPPYTPSMPAPSYSADLLPDEKRLGFSPRHRGRRLPQGTFTKKAKFATISLNRQEEGCDVPTYGLQALITGEVSLHCRQSITKVELKVDGVLELMTDVSGFSRHIVHDSTTLWEGPRGELCPGEIAFGHHFPATFQDGSVRRPLPPSFCSHIDIISTLHAKCSYRLSLIVTYQKMGILNTHKKIRIPIKYYPRSKPPRSLISSPLLSSVKVQPDEWMQLSSMIEPKLEAAIKPLHCHFFIPSVQVYALPDTIPFHIQLSGALSSLRQLYDAESRESPQITVKLLRQIVIDTDGWKKHKTMVIGQGTVCAVPPSVSAQEGSESGDHYLDWEGEVRCDQSVDVGGFSCGPLIVQDYIILSITPSAPSKSGFKDHVHRHFIKIVTDSWEEQNSQQWDEWP